MYEFETVHTGDVNFCDSDNTGERISEKVLTGCFEGSWYKHLLMEMLKHSPLQMHFRVSARQSVLGSFTNVAPHLRRQKSSWFDSVAILCHMSLILLLWEKCDVRYAQQS